MERLRQLAARRSCLSENKTCQQVCRNHCGCEIVGSLSSVGEKSGGEEMKAIEFVNQYIEILEELDQVIKPELYPAIRSLYVIDPHDLITPETWFPSRDAAVGFVWRILAKRAKEITSAD